MNAMQSTAGIPARGTMDGAARRILAQQRRDRMMRYVYGAGLPIVLLLIWQVCSYLNIIDARFFPSPSRILAVAGEIATSPDQRLQIVSDVLKTLQRCVLGYVLGAVAGIVAGAAMGIYRPVRYALAPMVYSTFPTPKLAIFPLLIVIFGIGDASKTALIALAVFYMTCINTLTGVLHANPLYLDFARAFRLPVGVKWMRVVLPSALPSIMAGLKLGIGQALIMVVSSEFVSSSDGIGYYIWTSWQMLDIARMFVGLVVVMLIGGIAVFLSNIVERWLLPWVKQ